MALVNAFLPLALVMAGVNAGVQVETAVGRAPLSSQADPVRISASTLAPSVGVTLAQRRGEAAVSYSPRLLLQVPNVADTRRPLVLHRGDFAWGFRPSNTSEWQTALDGVVGELDYQTAQEVLGNNQSALPDADRTLVLRGDADTVLTWQTAPRWRWLWGASANRSQSLRQPSTFPSTVDLETRTGAVHQLSRHTDLQVQGALGYARLEEQRFALWRNQISLTHRLSSEVSVAGGLGYTYFFALNAAARELDTNAVSPSAEVGINARFAQSESVVTTHAASLSLEPRTDPVLNRITSRVSFAWASVVAWNRHWDVSAQLGASTNTSRQPLPGEPDETLGTARSALEFRPGPEHLLYLGARLVVRNPHLSLGYEPAPLEYWGFLGYQLHFDVVKAPERAALPVVD